MHQNLKHGITYHRLCVKRNSQFCKNK